MLAFTTLEIAQGSDADIIAGLEAIAEVLEVHAVTGPGDLHVRVVARSNEHLHDVLQRILQLPGITRTETHLALHSSIQRTVADLIATRAALVKPDVEWGTADTTRRKRPGRSSRCGSAPGVHPDAAQQDEFGFPVVLEAWQVERSGRGGVPGCELHRPSAVYSFSSDHRIFRRHP